MIPEEWIPPDFNLFDYVKNFKPPSQKESIFIKYAWFGSDEAFRKNVASLKNYIDKASKGEIEEMIYGALYQGWKMREVWWEWSSRN